MKTTMLKNKPLKRGDLKKPVPVKKQKGNPRKGKK